jgi:hypothetical protein
MNAAEEREPFRKNVFQNRDIFYRLLSVIIMDMAGFVSAAGANVRLLWQLNKNFRSVRHLLHIFTTPL